MDPSARCRHTLNVPQLQKEFIIFVLGSRACSCIDDFKAKYILSLTDW